MPPPIDPTPVLDAERPRPRARRASGSGSRAAAAPAPAPAAPGARPPRAPLPGLDRPAGPRAPAAPWPPRALRPDEPACVPLPATALAPSTRPAGEPPRRLTYAPPPGAPEPAPRPAGPATPAAVAPRPPARSAGQPAPAPVPLRPLPPAGADREGGAETAAEANLALRILQPLLRYMHQTFGPVALLELAAAAEIPPEQLALKECWITYRQFEGILIHCRERIGSDQEFMNACAFEMKKLYGPMLLLIRAMTVRRAYRIMADTSHVVMKRRKMTVEDGPSHSSIRMRYESDDKESRLACLSRQAQLGAIPSVWWGMRPGVVTESACLAHGDPACVYTIEWYEPLRWRRPLAGMVLGSLAALAVPATVATAPVAVTALSALGIALGYILEQRRVITDHVEFADRERLELEDVLREHAHAVDEVLALHHRAQEWSEVQEGHIASHTARLERIIEHLRSLGERRETTLRSLSHDIRNPMVVFNIGLGLLRQRLAERDADVSEIMDDLQDAVRRMQRMVDDLMGVVTEQQEEAPFPVEPVEVAGLAERLRRQLSAMVMGRDIRVSVFTAREAPDVIHTYPMLLGRLLDNLLSNAAKYTERGSVVIEISGQAQTLSLKISDTGRGISSEKLARVFVGGEPDVDPLVGTSRGLGMSIVVRLLDQLGGRLEVMSKPNIGTTFWVYLPHRVAEAPAPSGGRGGGDEPLGAVMARVVKIRPQ